MPRIVYTVIHDDIPTLTPGQIGFNLADGLLFWLDEDEEVHSAVLVDALDPAYIATDNESVCVASDALVRAVAEAVIAAVLGPVPPALNLSTLSKIAAAIGDDPAYAQTAAEALSQAVSALEGAIGDLAAVASSGDASDLSGTLSPDRIATGALEAGKLASGAAASNVGTLGGALSGTLPSPGIAANATTDGAFVVNGLLTSGVAKQAALTVAQLNTQFPAADYPYARFFVTDANATTFRGIVAGSGSNKVPVHSDGTNWRIG